MEVVIGIDQRKKKKKKMNNEQIKQLRMDVWTLTGISIANLMFTAIVMFLIVLFILK